MKAAVLIPSLLIALATFASAPLVAQVSSATSAGAASGLTGYTLSGEEAVASLTSQFAAHYRVQGELSLELLRPWTAPTRSNAPVELTILEFPSVLAPSLLVRVQVQSGGRSLGESTLALHCQLFREVWVVRGPLEVGATFDASQFDTRRVDVLHDRDIVPVTDGDANFIYARTVPSGRLLSPRDLARRPLIRKGEVVEVSAVDGALTITMKALAMENGAAGETVKVRNIESKKEFPVTVIADARGLVRF